MRLDCTACKKERTMVKASVGRFPLFIQFIGGLFAVPSFLGMLFGVIVTMRAVTTLNNGIEIGTGAIAGLTIISPSAIGGLIGWLLVMRKKVYKCSRCGFVLDRA